MDHTMEEYKALAAMIPGNVVVYRVMDKDKIERVFYSKGVPKLSGHTEEEFRTFTSDNSLELIIEEDQKVIGEKMQEAIVHGGNMDIVYRLKHKTQGFIWAHMIAGKVGEVDHRPIFIATILDVTHEMLNSYGIMEASDRSICVIAKDNKRLLYANSKFYELIHMKPSDSMGVFCYDALCGNPAFKHDNNCLCFSTINIDKPLEYYNSDTKQYLSMYGRELKWGEHDAYVFYLLDRTEEKYKDLQLRNAQERFNATLNNSGLFIWEYDMVNNQCINSEKAVRDYGVPLVIDHYPESLFEMGHTPPETVAQIKEVKQRLLRGETGFSVERRTVDKDGKSQWMKVDYSLETDENGKPIRALVCGTDITAQKELEAKYEEQMAYRNNLAKNALFSMRVDLETQEITDYTCLEAQIEQVLCKHKNIEETLKLLCRNISFFTQKDREGSICFDTAKLMESYQVGENHLTTNYYCELLDKVLSLNVVMAQNPATEHVEAFYVFVDITVSHTTQRALRSVIDIDYDFVSIIDMKTGKYTNLSPWKKHAVPIQKEGDFEQVFLTYLTQFEECFGALEERDYFIKEMTLEEIRHHLQKEESYEFNMEYERQPGVYETYRLRYRYLDEKKEAVILTRSNVTAVIQEEKKNRQRLADALEHAKKASLAKTEFLSTVSHDMRTPMNGILGVARLLKEKEDVQEIHEDVDQILLSGQYLLRLINDTLDMNRIEAGKLQLQKNVVNGAEVFQNILIQAQMLAKDKGIDLLVYDQKSKQENWQSVLTDQARLEQIFMNIISNAIKYTPAGGTVELEIENIALDDRTLRDRYVIRDNGIGMSPEFLPHIFDAFQQEGRISTERQNGTGLGMSIVKQLIDMMDGTITINSTLHEGTEVIVELPFEISERTLDKQETGQADRSVLAGKKILLCEDHPLNQKIAVAMLKKEKIQVILCGNGLEGIQAFQREAAGEVAAILMDIRMPVMDGITAAREIRVCGKEDARTVPIIAMTANAFEEDIRLCKEAGMNEHLSKPYKPDELYDILVKYMI